MLSERAPEPANTVVTVTKTVQREESGVTAEQCPTVHRDVPRAALYLAHINSHLQETPPTPAPVPELPEKSIWSAVLDFFVEGFANCSTLYSAVHLSAAGPLLDADVPLREAFAANERRLSLVPNAPRPAAGTNQVASGLAVASQVLLDGPSLYPGALSNRAPPTRSLADEGAADPAFSDSNALSSQEVERPNHWNLLRSCWDVVVALRAHMRREREIGAAIEALAQLDDGMLKDIGIHQRSHIEYAVRNGNGV